MTPPARRPDGAARQPEDQKCMDQKCVDALDRTKDDLTYSVPGYRLRELRAAEAELREKDTECAEWYSKALAAQQDRESAEAEVRQLREERDDEKKLTEFETSRAEELARQRDAAEAEVERLREDLRDERNDAVQDEAYIKKLKEQAEAAEAERDHFKAAYEAVQHFLDERDDLRDTVRRLTEGLREVRSHLRPQIGGRFDQHAAVDAIDRALLSDNPPQGDAAEGSSPTDGYTMDQGAIIPTDQEPHEFQGRADRWCEVCDLPDRHPVHRLSASPSDGGGA